MIERIAWEPDKRGRDRATRELDRLVGRRLKGVRYFELKYDDGQPRWCGPAFHTLDYGLELDVSEPAATWSWAWKQAGDNEALLVYSGSLRGDQLVPDGSCGVWDVSDSVEWRKVTGEVIAGVEVAWTRGAPGRGV